MKTRRERKKSQEIRNKSPEEILSNAKKHLALRMELGKITYREFKLALDSLIAAEMRLAVKPTPSVISSKEMRSLEKVMSDLEKGINPFAVSEMKKRDALTTLGSSSPAPIQLVERVVTPEELEKKTSYWKSNASNRKHSAQRFLKGSSFMKELGLETDDEVVPTKTTPGLLKCHFCGKEVNHIIATIGKTTRISSVTYTSGKSYFQSTDIQVACDEHAHLITSERIEFSSKE